MFNNIGGKIKGLAMFLTIVGIIASIISGGAIIGSSSHLGVLIGLLVMIVGSILSWVGSFLLYGFGQLVESAQNIERELTGSTDEFEPEQIEADEKYIPTVNKSEAENNASMNYIAVGDSDTDNSEKTGLNFTSGILYCATCGTVVEPGDPVCTGCKKAIDWNLVTKTD